MYAAAGGASLASRQARQRQRQQKRSQQLQAKLHPPKLSAVSITENNSSTTSRTQSRQFHQLPTNYLRTPQTQARKLSASYTTPSKLLLPIDECDNQSVSQSRLQFTQGHSQIYHSHSHSIPYHPRPLYQSTGQQHHSHGNILLNPKISKSATATLPLVSQVEATPPNTPSVAVEGSLNNIAKVGLTSSCHTTFNLMYKHDAIFVTPATPVASPGHLGMPINKTTGALTDIVRKTVAISSSSGLKNDDDLTNYPEKMQKRKCSLYVMRRNDTPQHPEESLVGCVSSSVMRQLKDLQQAHYEPLLDNEPHLCYKGLPNRRKLQQCAYCEEGICACDHIECTRGRAAWLERGRRCSLQEAQQEAACHRRWIKHNRIQDGYCGGSSDDEDALGVLRGPSSFANAFLYIGLGTIALGLIIAFVGTGEKGFKTVELRFIGPTLIGLGFVCCVLRILFCICPSKCISSSQNNVGQDCNKSDPDYTTSLLHRGDINRIPVLRRSSFQTKFPLAHKRSNTKILNEGMEALRQIATTSLFMQNEQKPSQNRVVPIIKEPEHILKRRDLSGGKKINCKEEHIMKDILHDSDQQNNIDYIENSTKVATITANQENITTDSETKISVVDKPKESESNVLGSCLAMKLSRQRMSHIQLKQV